MQIRICIKFYLFYLSYLAELIINPGRAEPL